MKGYFPLWFLCEFLGGVPELVILFDAKLVKQKSKKIDPEV